MTQTPVPVGALIDRGDRILDAALALMATRGAAGTSMRQVASACNRNVATIYHYFPSKAFLLRSILEERRYGERLRVDGPRLDESDPPRDRLVALIDWLRADAVEDEAVWRLLLGESLRGEEAAASALEDVLDLLATRIAEWLRAGFPELAGGPTAIARVVRSHVLALVVEHLASRPMSTAAARRRAEELAAVVLP